MSDQDLERLEELPHYERNVKRFQLKPGRAARQCQGKATFKSFERARMSTRKIGLGNTGRKMHPYRCEFCRRWHIGH